MEIMEDIEYRKEDFSECEYSCHPEQCTECRYNFDDEDKYFHYADYVFCEECFEHFAKIKELFEENDIGTLRIHWTNLYDTIIKEYLEEDGFDIGNDGLYKDFFIFEGFRYEFESFWSFKDILSALSDFNIYKKETRAVFLNGEYNAK